MQLSSKQNCKLNENYSNHVGVILITNRHETKIQVQRVGRIVHQLWHKHLFDNTGIPTEDEHLQ
jgi:hypothetical protein